MKSKSLVVFLTMTILIGLFASKTPVFAKDYIVPKSFCVTKNQYQYCFVPYGKVSKIYPIYETQVQHTKGITTTVTVSKTYSHTFTASSSVSASFKTGFVFTEATINAQGGISTSDTTSIGASIAFTVPASTDNGRYRVEHVHEIYDAIYGSYTLDGASEQVFTKYSLPGYKDSYTRFIQYAN